MAGELPSLDPGSWESRVDKPILKREEIIDGSQKARNGLREEVANTPQSPTPPAPEVNEVAQTPLKQLVDALKMKDKLTKDDLEKVNALHRKTQRESTLRPPLNARSGSTFGFSHSLYESFTTALEGSFDENSDWHKAHPTSPYVKARFLAGDFKLVEPKNAAPKQKPIAPGQPEKIVIPLNKEFLRARIKGFSTVNNGYQENLAMQDIKDVFAKLDSGGQENLAKELGLDAGIRNKTGDKMIQWTKERGIVLENVNTKNNTTPQPAIETYVRNPDLSKFIFRRATNTAVLSPKQMENVDNRRQDFILSVPTGYTAEFNGNNFTPTILKNGTQELRIPFKTLQEVLSKIKAVGINPEKAENTLPFTLKDKDNATVFSRITVVLKNGKWEITPKQGQ